MLSNPCLNTRVGKIFMLDHAPGRKKPTSHLFACCKDSKVIYRRNLTFINLMNWGHKEGHLILVIHNKRLGYQRLDTTEKCLPYYQNITCSNSDDVRAIHCQERSMGKKTKLAFFRLCYPAPDFASTAVFNKRCCWFHMHWRNHCNSLVKQYCKVLPTFIVYLTL